MAKLVAVTACPTGIAHTVMAAEALRRVAALKGHDIAVETRGSEGVSAPLDPAAVAAADVVIVAADITVDESRFQGKQIIRTSTALAIRETGHIIDEAVARAARSPASTPPVAASTELSVATATPVTVLPKPAPVPGGSGRLVAITACPTGIAHTFMAAEALTRAAKARGYDIKVETQGSVGAKNTLTAEEIAAADAVIIGADTHVSTDRFAGKRLLKTSVGEALKQADSVVTRALALPAPPAGASAAEAVVESGARPKGEPSGPYKHLLTGVSFMLPFVVAGGLVIALSFIFGIEAFKEEGTLPAALMRIGQAAFSLMVPALAGYIAYSIADRPGLAPGFIGGMLAGQLGAGFLGGIVAGFLAGYVARWLREHIRLPANLEGLKPVLVLPLLASLVVGLLMVYVIGAPAAAIMNGLTGFLTGLSGTNAILLGLLLGAMVAVDTGGPVNKAAYAFAVGLLGSNTFTPMAAVMAAGMTPPLGLALATVVARSRFTLQEREAGKAAAVLGLAFITEGAIPFAAKDPLRVIPSIVFGSAVTGALSMWFGCALRAPHGGVFVLAIPNAVQPVGLYLVALLAGTLATTLALIVLKRPLPEEPVLVSGEPPRIPG
ncbi:PTS fructose-like transporter subunit IIB [Pyxidicoccus xibeiensis]|uniref:PTS fructose-like transporter subunit IIB n=1 Tax=Pyxidicoccus xibeiensis TaxID=2906759 RepID=UPI0020A72E06|nr:PTS fructose-like transporter subunit IIB [Pyxidicoccus xibeiensis]MCP3142678.1 PTS fructose-like transporter subunit IIB [Pyxidicoccus xibeiensis]